MRLPQIVIPSTFVAQDTNTNATDSFANVHDHHIARRNMNILLAQRVRKSMLQCACSTHSLSIGASIETRMAPSSSARPILSTPIYMTQYTKQMVFKFRATKKYFDPAFTGHPKIYARIRDPSSASATRVVDCPSVSVTSASLTTYSLTLSVPEYNGAQLWHHGRIMMLFEVFLESVVDTEDLSTGIAITDAGDNWFKSTTGLSVGDFVYWSNVDIDGRYITHVLSAVTRTYFLDEPFNIIPIPGTDTLSWTNLVGVIIYSYSLYELAVSDFNAGYAV